MARFNGQKNLLSLQNLYKFAVPLREGGLAEWLMAAVLKTVDLNGFGGSNPSPSAKRMRNQASAFFVFWRSQNGGEFGHCVISLLMKAVDELSAAGTKCRKKAV